MATDYDLAIARDLVKTLDLMTRGIQPAQALDESLNRGQRHIGAEAGYAWLSDQSGRIWAWASTDGSSPRTDVLDMASLEGEIELMPGVLLSSTLPDTLPIFTWPEGSHSVLGAAIVDEAGQTLGGIYYLRAGKQPPFSDEDRVLMEYLILFTGLGIRTGQRMRSLRDAEEARTLQGDYLQQVSHDIRSPLASIVGAANLLNTHPDIDEDKRNLLLNNIQISGEKISSLVEALLQIARAETGKLPLNRVPFLLETWIKELLQSIRPLGEDDYEIKIEPGLALETDQHHLGQIIANLVSNSYSHGTAPRRLRAWSEGDIIKISLGDSGPGLPPEIAEALGGKYLPGAKGVGLGLSIAYSLAHALGGELEWTKAKECFTLSLPCKIEA
jgi:signal transduction histidine kinase